MLAASLLLFRFLASRKVGCRGVYRGDLETNRESQDRRPDPELSFFALEVSTDELLGLHSANGKSKAKSNGRKPSRRVLRRLEKIEDLPTHQQAVLLKTIDTFIKAAGK